MGHLCTRHCGKALHMSLHSLDEDAQSHFVDEKTGSERYVTLPNVPANKMTALIEIFVRQTQVEVKVSTFTRLDLGAGQRAREVSQHSSFRGWGSWPCPLGPLFPNTPQQNDPEQAAPHRAIGMACWEAVYAWELIRTFLERYQLNKTSFLGESNLPEPKVLRTTA